MKAIQLILSFFFGTLIVEASSDLNDISTNEDFELEKALSDELTRDDPQVVNIDVSYDILEKPSLSFDKPIEFGAEEFATFNFTFRNYEDSNVTVLGILGNVVSNPEGYLVANITEKSVGPHEVPPNGTLHFQTAIQLVLPEGSFYLAPMIAIFKDGGPMRLGIRPLSIFVLPPTMSFFNPSFLSVQIIIACIIAGVTYLMLNSNRSGPKRSKKSTISKPVDESWLPETHKK